LDSGELSTSTDTAGDYALSNVSAGTYTVREIAPANFVPATTPAITVSNGSTATVDLPNAQIVYAGTAGNDSYLLRRNLSGKYEVLTNGSLAYTVFAGAPSFTFNLGGGDDVLSIDFSGVTRIPGGGVSFDGGTGADTIAVVGSAAADTT